jgi:uncharacterized phage protein (TIGR02220 family)
MAGWIKLHRSLIEWEWYQNANMMRMFVHLLLNANHKPAKWQGIQIERGQFLTSRDHLAKDLKLSVMQVRTALGHLEETQEVSIETTSRYTLITLCKYGSYQCGEDEGNQVNNQQVTSDQPTDNQQVTTNKKDKKKKNENNEKKTTLSGKPDAMEILNYLNFKAGKSFRPVEAHIKMIAARLKEAGVTVEGVRQMIDSKCNAWLTDDKMGQYLRPQTLFNKTKFANYYDQRNNENGGVKETPGETF